MRTQTLTAKYVEVCELHGVQHTTPCTYQQEEAHDNFIAFWDEQCAQPLDMDRSDLPF